MNIAIIVIGGCLLATMTLIGALVYSVIVLDRSVVRYPDAIVLSDRSRVSANMHNLHLLRSASYRTKDQVPDILDWYLGRFEFDLDMKAQSGCLHLSGSTNYFGAHNQTSLTVCETPHGRLVFVQRSDSLLP